MALKPQDPNNFAGIDDDEILAEIQARRADAESGLDPHERFVEKYKRREKARYNAAQGEWGQKATLWNSVFHPFRYERETNAIMRELDSSSDDYLDTLERSIKEKIKDAAKSQGYVEARKVKD